MELAAIPADHPYWAEVARIKAGEDGLDFHALRMRYTETSHYQPYFGPEDALSRPMFEAIDAEDFAACQEAAARLLAYDYASLPGHYGAMLCSIESGDEEAGLYHRWALHGLVDDIQRNGDGRSKDTAFQTLSVAEVHFFLQLLGVTAKGQSMVHDEEGQVYDVMTVSEPGEEQTYELYFDISIQMQKGLADFFKD